ncbi:hypothetical protein FS749_000525 [Ceratobasidium sp. UAMH 11750]|nr:hypothetical protein FS749_000525 [Ceratobasidium sp. UAMH 11750]
MGISGLVPAWYATSSLSSLFPVRFIRHTESKYSHAAVWPLLPGFTGLGGERASLVAAMVANIAKPTPGYLALMRHDDVVTFFHETGNCVSYCTLGVARLADTEYFSHVSYGLLSQTQFARFHGTRVARDFVEAPSQMLENWCREPEVLKKMSNRFEKKEPLSDDIIKKLID